MAERLIRIDAVAAKSPGSMSRFCLTTEQTTSIAADLRQRGWVVDFYDCEDEHDQALIDTLIAGVWPLAPMKLIESLACEYLNNGPTLLAHGE